MHSGYRCEVCEGKVCRVYDYPTGVEKRLDIERDRRTFRAVVRNNGVFVAKTALGLLPDWGIPKLNSLRPRIEHRQWLSRLQLPSIRRNLEYGASLFQGRRIRVCDECGFGAVFPSLSEDALTDYYARTYWLASATTLEPAENPRTITIYKLVEGYVDFERVRSCLEFGSASAQLSRYFRQRYPHLQISVVEAGANWQKLLRSHVASIYDNICDVSSGYDILLSSHSLEHVSDVRQYFQHFVDSVTEGGFLVFEVPNSAEADVIFGPVNPDYHIPHTYFFTPLSFVKLAERYNLSVLSMKTFNRSYSQILNNVQNGIDGTMENPDGAYLRVLLQKA